MDNTQFLSHIVTNVQVDIQLDISYARTQVGYTWSCRGEMRPASYIAFLVKETAGTMLGECVHLCVLIKHLLKRCLFFYDLKQ